MAFQEVWDKVNIFLWDKVANTLSWFTISPCPSLAFYYASFFFIDWQIYWRSGNVANTLCRCCQVWAFWKAEISLLEALSETSLFSSQSYQLNSLHLIVSFLAIMMTAYWSRGTISSWHEAMMVCTGKMQKIAEALCWGVRSKLRCRSTEDMEPS